MNCLLITYIGDKKKTICNNSHRHVVCQITDAMKKRYTISISHEDSRVERKRRISIRSLIFGTRRTTQLSGLSASLTLPPKKTLGTNLCYRMSGPRATECGQKEQVT